MKYVLFLLYPLTIFHYITYLTSNRDVKSAIDEDVAYMNQRCKRTWSLAKYLIYEKPYRNLFYYRTGKTWHFFLKYLLPSYPLFNIGCRKIEGGAFVLNHPYASIINAKSIGKHFTICQCTTIGNKQHGRNGCLPTIGDNVMLGANVCILGDISIGNNVVVAAGSIVVHDVPDNCMVAGNPAVIKKRFQ